MSLEKPNLKSEFCNNGDIRVILDLIQKYTYTDCEVEEVINFYEPYIDDYIPEVEHIEVLIQYFKNSKITDATMSAINKSFPER